MNRNDEDLLIQAAFDEADAEELARLEHMLAADPKRQKSFRVMQELRDDLRSMAEVPECQLSVERMRDAILAQNLQPRRWWHGFRPVVIGAPLAMAGVLAVFALFLPRPSQPELTPSTPELVAVSPTAPVAELPESQAPVVVAESAAPTVLSEPAVDPRPAARRAAPRGGERMVASATQTEAQPMETMMAAETAKADVAAPTPGLGGAGPEPMVMASGEPKGQVAPAQPAPAASQQPARIVILGPSSNRLTGTSQATESGTSDVVFGG